MRAHFYILVMFAGWILVSCNTKSVQKIENTDFIEITKSQFESENMELGEPQQMPFSELVEFTGTIIPSVSGKAQISLSVQGAVSRIVCNMGQHVVKGQVLFEISGNDLIDMQRDFAESYANLLRLGSEYQRMKELFNDNIGTQKELILAESSYKSEKARNTALKIKLENIGLDMTKIEDGSFYNSYTVKSPLNGYITSINATIGQYIEQQQIVAEVIDMEQFKLKLAVFEKDINKLKSKQNIVFYFIGDKKKTYHARLSVVGKTINSETKAIDCYADIEDMLTIRPVNNQFAEGQLVVDSFSVYAVPVEAVLKSENENYVLNLEKETDECYYFSKIKVNTGRKDNEYIELTEKPKTNKLLIKGVYNLQVE